jgi:hypothetical protein
MGIILLFYRTDVAKEYRILRKWTKIMSKIRHRRNTFGKIRRIYVLNGPKGLKAARINGVHLLFLFFIFKVFALLDFLRLEPPLLSFGLFGRFGLFGLPFGNVSLLCKENCGIATGILGARDLWDKYCITRSATVDSNIWSNDFPLVVASIFSKRFVLNASLGCTADGSYTSLLARSAGISVNPPSAIASCPRLVKCLQSHSFTVLSPPPVARSGAVG